MTEKRTGESGSLHMKVVLQLAACFAASVGLMAQATPDLTGVWKLRTTRPGYVEVWTVKQTASDIRIRMDITDDRLGDRVLSFQAPFDGSERKQTVIGTPASVKAAWDGNTLVLEIKRRARPDLLLHTGRRLRLAGDSKRIESRTIQYSPLPETARDEVFDRQ